MQNKRPSKSLSIDIQNNYYQPVLAPKKHRNECKGPVLEGRAKHLASRQQQRQNEKKLLNEQSSRQINEQMSSLKKCSSNNSLISDLQLQIDEQDKFQSTRQENKVIIKVSDGVYIGGENSIWDIQTISTNYISHLIVVKQFSDNSANQIERQEVSKQNYVPEAIAYIHYVTHSFNIISPQTNARQNCEDVLQTFKKISQFITHAHSQGESCLIISRSINKMTHNLDDIFECVYSPASLACGYLMYKFSWSMLKGLQFISSRLNSSLSVLQILKKMNQRMKSLTETSLQQNSQQPRPNLSLIPINILKKLQKKLLQGEIPLSYSWANQSSGKCEDIEKINQQLVIRNTFLNSVMGTQLNNQLKSKQKTKANSLSTTQLSVRSIDEKQKIKNSQSHSQSQSHHRILIKTKSTEVSLKQIDYEGKQKYGNTSISINSNRVISNISKPKSQQSIIRVKHRSSVDYGVKMNNCKATQTDRLGKNKEEINQSEDDVETASRKFRNKGKRISWATQLCSQQTFDKKQSKIVGSQIQIHKQKMGLTNECYLRFQKQIAEYKRSMENLYKLKVQQNEQGKESLLESHHKIQVITGPNERENKEQLKKEAEEKEEEGEWGIIVEQTNAKKCPNFENTRRINLQKQQDLKNRKNKIVVNVISIINNRNREAQRNSNIQLQANQNKMKKNLGSLNKKSKTYQSKPKLPTMQELLQNAKQFDSEQTKGQKVQQITVSSKCITAPRDEEFQEILEGKTKQQSHVINIDLGAIYSEGNEMNPKRMKDLRQRRAHKDKENKMKQMNKKAEQSTCKNSKEREEVLMKERSIQRKSLSLTIK